MYNPDNPYVINENYFENSTNPMYDDKPYHLFFHIYFTIAFLLALLLIGILFYLIIFKVTSQNILIRDCLNQKELFFMLQSNFRYFD
jgi:hypothetical protein